MTGTGQCASQSCDRQATVRFTWRGLGTPLCDEHSEECANEYLEPIQQGEQATLVTDGGVDQPGSEHVECPECGGDGLVRHGCTQEECPICDGGGSIPTDHWRVEDDGLRADGGPEQTESEQIKLAVPKPDSEGAHAIVMPVDGITDSEIPDGRAVTIVGGAGAVLTSDQCYRLSEHFNRVGEVLERYHNGGESDAE